MSHSGTARLFIALDLPDAITNELGAWARMATRQARAGGPEPASEPPGGARERSRKRTPDRHGMRLLEPEQMHLTMHFLGSRPVHEIEPLAEVLARLAPAAVGEVSLGAPLWLPKRGPRVLAVEVHDEGNFLATLHSDLADALALEGLLTPGRRNGRPAQAGPGRGRPLHPHVTVARMRQGSAPRERTLAPTPQLSFLPQRLVLYRSLLAPAGASYEALASCQTIIATAQD